MLILIEFIYLFSGVDKSLAYYKVKFLVVLICNKCVSLVSVLCIKWKLMYIFFYIYNYVFHEQGWSWYTWYTYFLIARDTFGVYGCNEGYPYFSFTALLLECVPASLLYFYFSLHYLPPSEFWPSSPSFSLWCPELLFKAVQFPSKYIAKSIPTSSEHSWGHVLPDNCREGPDISGIGPT